MSDIRKGVREWSKLKIDAAHKHIEHCVKYNINKKDGNGDTPLILLERYGRHFYTQDRRFELMELFKDTVNDIGQRGATALFYAVLNDDIKAVKYLLKNNASPHIKNNEGDMVVEMLEHHLNITAFHDLDPYIHDIIDLLKNAPEVSVPSNVINKNCITSLDIKKSAETLQRVRDMQRKAPAYRRLKRRPKS